MIRKFFSTCFTFLIDVYRWGISPLMPSVCRHDPSCSNYMREAIAEHGPFKGVRMGFKRIMKCHPWGSYGYDPVEKIHMLKNNECN